MYYMYSWHIVFLSPFSQRLEQLNQYPDFNNYLIFVLTKLKSEGKLPVYLLHYAALSRLYSVQHVIFT